MDHNVLSIGPEAVDLVSERRAIGAPVKDRKRLVELVGGLLSSTPSSQVNSSPYSFCKQFMRRSRKCASEFLVGLCNPIVSCNTYEKLCNGYLGGKDRSARLTGIPNMDS